MQRPLDPARHLFAELSQTRGGAVTSDGNKRPLWIDTRSKLLSMTPRAIHVPALQAWLSDEHIVPVYKYGLATRGHAGRSWGFKQLAGSQASEDINNAISGLDAMTERVAEEIRRRRAAARS